MSKRTIKSFISGCAGLSLSSEEKAFFAEHQPWGLILFSRNVESPLQLRKLTADFRSVVQRKDAPVFIDQEGGRVQRMGPPQNHWRKYPPAAAFGQFFKSSKLHALRATRNVARLMAHDLREAGINANCVPVLDVPQPGSHKIVGDRAFGTDPGVVLLLARAQVAGMLEGGVLPVMKHMPGHGRALVDSHLDLPVVSADRAQLEAVDFYTFAGFLDCPMAMTAHVVFEAIDADYPATLSKRVIRDVIRKQLGYAGLLMTDDLSMKALKGSYAEKTKLALAAGCDVVLHCNGKMEEMAEVAAAAPPLRGKSLAKAKAALRHLRRPLNFDIKTALADLAEVFRHVPAES